MKNSKKYTFLEKIKKYRVSKIIGLFLGIALLLSLLVATGSFFSSVGMKHAVLSDMETKTSYNYCVEHMWFGSVYPCTSQEQLELISEEVVQNPIFAFFFMFLLNFVSWIGLLNLALSIGIVMLARRYATFTKTHRSKINWGILCLLITFFVLSSFTSYLNGKKEVKEYASLPQVEKLYEDFLDMNSEFEPILSKQIQNEDISLCDQLPENGAFHDHNRQIADFGIFTQVYALRKRCIEKIEPKVFHNYTDREKQHFTLHSILFDLKGYGAILKN